MSRLDSQQFPRRAESLTLADRAFGAQKSSGARFPLHFQSWLRTSRQNVTEEVGGVILAGAVLVGSSGFRRHQGLVYRCHHMVGLPADVGCQNIVADQALLDAERQPPAFRAKVILGFWEEPAV